MLVIHILRYIQAISYTLNNLRHLIHCIFNNIEYRMVIMKLRRVITHTLSTIILACIVTGCAQGANISTSPEAQKIKDYMTKIDSTVKKDGRLTDDFNSFILTASSKSSPLDKNMMQSKLSDFKVRANEILAEINQSQPPAELQNVKTQWTKQYELLVQAITKMQMAIDNLDVSKFTEAENLLNQSNSVRNTYIREFQAILDKYQLNIHLY